MKGQITISRTSRDEVRVQIVDVASGVRFVTAELTLETFARALTGQAYQDCTLSVNRLSEVGKQRVVEDRVIVYDGSPYDSRNDMEQWLAANAQEEGWEVMPYLGSQNSVSRHDGYTALRYRVQKFVDTTEGSDAPQT